MNLRMTVMAAGNAISRARGLDLLVFQSSVFQTFLLVAGLEKAAAAAATVIVGTVGNHVDEIFLAHDGFDNETQVFGNGVAVAFTDDLAGVLNRKFDFEVLVPVGINLEFSFPDPSGIVFIDIFDFEIVFDVEFLQSEPDRESDVPSLGIEKRFAPQCVGLVR
jgi:hypothetical protein